MKRIHRHKFKAKPQVLDGFHFDSKKESVYYTNLKLDQKAVNGNILFFLRQVPIYLPGGVKLVIDFLEFHRDGKVCFVDVKGYETKDWKMKRKMVESLYPITIEVV